MEDFIETICQMRFPQKLWYLLNMNTEAILWGGTGKTVLLNYRILHKYLQCKNSIFKTSNIASFVRQLNLYGFRKVTSHLQDPLCNSSNPFMHEYVHDYFQYGKPELLNKITRKAFNMKKSFKSKNSNGFENIYLTPLQKARKALRVALRKATQELLDETKSNRTNDFGYYLEGEDDLCNETDEDEPIWDPKSYFNPEGATISNPVVSKEVVIEKTTMNNTTAVDSNEGNKSYNCFDEEVNHDSNVNLPTQYLSMPELDPIPVEDSNEGLLAAFQIPSNTFIDGANEVKKDFKASKNCVLPSIISCDQNDVAMMQKESKEYNHYQGDWDQVFQDIMTKNSHNECGSDLKEIYSQISKTIDLLNS